MIRIFLNWLNMNQVAVMGSIRTKNFVWNGFYTIFFSSSLKSLQPVSIQISWGL